VARAFAGADPHAPVLLCAFELCSLHYHYGWDPGKVVANAIFADGAAALVGAASTVGPANAWQVTATGSRLFPDTANAMTWTVGDHGFVMSLSKKVPGLIQAHLRPWLVDWLGQHDLTVEDVASWAVHPGGPRILAAVEESLGLSRRQTEAAHAVFADYGNMSSPTVLFIVDRLRACQAPRPCVALGFGPGLTAEVALFR
jgi:predicted naringenin-chalcone synthase